MATAKKVKGKAAKPAGQIVALVNGQTTGSIEDGGSIVDAATKLAQSHGLKAFSIKVDGQVVKSVNAGKPLKGHKSLEIFAKDTRGQR